MNSGRLAATGTQIIHKRRPSAACFFNLSGLLYNSAATSRRLPVTMTVIAAPRA